MLLLVQVTNRFLRRCLLNERTWKRCSAEISFRLRSARPSPRGGMACGGASAFEVLGVSVSASPQEVQTAFRRACLTSHPDKGGSEAQMQAVLRARDVLLCPALRRAELEATRPAHAGMWVVLHGLVQAAHLNGEVAVAGDFDGLRMNVVLGESVKAVRPRNVRLSAGGGGSCNFSAAGCGFSCASAAASAGGVWASAAAGGGSSWASARTGGGGGAWAAASAESGAHGAGLFASSHARAAAGQEVPAWNGTIPCPGFGGIECPQWAWVAPRRGRCRTCNGNAAQRTHIPAARPTSDAPPPPAAAAVPATPPSPAAPSLSAATPPPVVPEPHSEELAAAEELARLLQISGEACFGGASVQADHRPLGLAVLCRLAFIADTERTPRQLRKRASHCGGVPPTSKLPPFHDTPLVSDPGNCVYAAVVDRLLREAPAEWRSFVGLAIFEKMQAFNEEHKADLVEAALAAGEAMEAMLSGRARTWGGLVGGAHAKTDMVTAWLVRAVHFQVCEF